MESTTPAAVAYDQPRTHLDGAPVGQLGVVRRGVMAPTARAAEKAARTRSLLLGGSVGEPAGNVSDLSLDLFSNDDDTTGLPPRGAPV